jgi:lipid-A-disaccharide synthase
MSITVGMVAGEPSGDLLAARVIHGIERRSPGSLFQGIAGPNMVAQGMDAWHSMDALTVFGYVDALKSMPSLLSTYFNVKRRWLDKRPDVFVGIDAPDFNLRLESQLKQSGVPTVHFVGPSIWAWRYERIHKIRASVSHMLVLFPFEVEIYEKENVPVTYVGHPLAQLIPMRPDKLLARRRLGLADDARVLALMPGSRSSEIRLLAPRFLQAVQILLRRDKSLQIVVPMVNAQRRAEFEALLREHQIENCRIVDAASCKASPKTDMGSSTATPAMAPQAASTSSLSGSAPDGTAQTIDRDTWPAAWHVMEAADAVLVASGTATLEAALFKRPMVISYVLSATMRRLMAWKSGQAKPYVPWVGLPNVLARDFLMPELLQDDAQPQALADEVWRALTDTAYIRSVVGRLDAIHESLHRDTPSLVADAILRQVEHGAK